MTSINASQLYQKISQLPDGLLHEISNYIDYLVFKSSKNDWANELSSKQISLIEKGIKAIEENKVVTHKEARKRIDNYIKNKMV